MPTVRPTRRRKAKQLQPHTDKEQADEIYYLDLLADTVDVLRYR